MFLSSKIMFDDLCLRNIKYWYIKICIPYIKYILIYICSIETLKFHFLFLKCNTCYILHVLCVKNNFFSQKIKFCGIRLGKLKLEFIKFSPWTFMHYFIKLIAPHCDTGIIIFTLHMRKTCQSSSTICQHSMDSKWWARGHIGTCWNPGPMLLTHMHMSGGWLRRVWVAHTVPWTFIHFWDLLMRSPDDSPDASLVSSPCTPGNICSTWSTPFSC